MRKILTTAFFVFITLSGCLAQVYLDPNAEMEDRIEDLLSKLTLEEKVSMCHASTKFSTASVDRLSVPPVIMSDGPHGVREEISADSWKPAGWTTDSATYLPVGTALAATWNPQMARIHGEVLGQEALFRKKDIILGPGINILRTPLCGRNFEYAGEDPYLISRMVPEYIKGVQDQGVAACIKHFIANNQEYERFKYNAIIGERALREIYFPGFKAAVQEGEVMTLMGAFNQFRGQFSCHNEYLLKDVLKGEWGFEGVVISDWDGTHDTFEAANNGLDIEMGTHKDYDQYYLATPFLEAIKRGEISEEVLDDKVRRILKMMFATNMFGERPEGSFATPQHFDATLKIAREAIVLLKNDSEVLPLDKSNTGSIAVIGDNAVRKHSHGGGSSQVKAKYEITPLAGLQKAVEGTGVSLSFSQGYSKDLKVDGDALIKAAVKSATESDVAIIFGGINHDFDVEGKDKPDMKLPYNQAELISAVAAVNPNTIVVMIGGSPVEMYQWADKVKGIVQMWYAGMEGGTAMAEIIFGKTNPSGKLPFTFPKKLEDSPVHAVEGLYPQLEAVYEEGILVGYRYYDTKNIEPQFCFGHGLSYTTFEYENLELKANKEGRVQATLKLTNSGDKEGSEVVQLYVSDEKSSVLRPVKELKGFEKVRLQPGESKELTFDLDESAFMYYSEAKGKWVLEPGRFTVAAGSSSRDLRLSGSIKLK